VLCIRDRNAALYKECNFKIENSSLRGAHAIYDGEIPEIEYKIQEFIKNNDRIDVCIDETVTKKVEKEKDSMSSLFNANTFRDFVMVGYNNLCAITGTVIRYESYTNLEAAHIKPKSHGGLFLPNNGMALCRDLHWAFDKGFYTLNDNYEVVVHPKTTSDYLKSFQGKQIYKPSNSFFVPDLDNIHYHNSEVYGLFLTTGRL
jgi:predicted restriction endonuclease